MVFSSTLFLFLALPLILGVYFVVPRALRNAWLLLVSLVFYAWGEPGFAPIMTASIAVNHGFGLWIDRTRRARHGRLVLGLALATNLGLLGVYKYANFFVANTNTLRAFAGSAPLEIAPIALPIGISFFTFHAMSYLIDIWRDVAVVQRGVVNTALYLLLFPQLVAGPIIRYHDIADQLLARRVDADGFAEGWRRFILGLGKKVLLANTLAAPCDRIFALPNTELTPGLAWLGILAYTGQIYFDFSGYSDMAIGLGRMFGFVFKENFRWPYVARDVREFWQRWHISLSTWFRDYLYIPLGGNRGSAARTASNLFTVFFLCGLWHGASWTFVVWGLYHGALLSLERTRFAAWVQALPRVARHAYTLVLVVIGWVFFRAETLTQAVAFLGNMSGVSSGSARLLTVPMLLQRDVLLALVAAPILATPLVPWLHARLDRAPRVMTEGLFEGAAAVGLLAVLCLCAVMLAAGTHNPFIYFRF